MQRAQQHIHQLQQLAPQLQKLAATAAATQHTVSSNGNSRHHGPLGTSVSQQQATLAAAALQQQVQAALGQLHSLGCPDPAYQQQQQQQAAGKIENNLNSTSWTWLLAN